MTTSIQATSNVSNVIKNIADYTKIVKIYKDDPSNRIKKFVWETYKTIEQLDVGTNWDQLAQDNVYVDPEGYFITGNEFDGYRRTKCCIGIHLAAHFNAYVNTSNRYLDAKHGVSSKTESWKYTENYLGIEAVCDWLEPNPENLRTIYQKWWADKLRDHLHCCGAPKDPFGLEPWPLHPREVWKNLIARELF